MAQFVEKRHSVCMVSCSMPCQTRLTRRLAHEGRLHANHDSGPSTGGDQCTDGINFDPARPLRDILMDYRQILKAVYHPAAYAPC
jgi:hypothetical protein